MLIQHFTWLSNRQTKFSIWFLFCHPSLLYLLLRAEKLEVFFDFSFSLTLHDQSITSTFKIIFRIWPGLIPSTAPQVKPRLCVAAPPSPGGWVSLSSRGHYNKYIKWKSNHYLFLTQTPSLSSCLALYCMLDSCRIWSLSLPPGLLTAVLHAHAFLVPLPFLITSHSRGSHMLQILLRYLCGLLHSRFPGSAHVSPGILSK